ncbi:uncharacterized protein LOC109721581 isoform X4 [Ananas comosus]|uniref:Uncharacterized protein LOC109721581 isoform X4 n=1 Tax=Ananas comosus TaxID=4615 RepID=A0A6P5GFW3_ANACO|nr:uncharacterized protein LOC109721581 isoform X4 [Ananas comosus]
MGGNRSHRIMERGGGGSTLGDRLWNVTWIKTLRNGILDELLFDLLLFVPISEDRRRKREVASNVRPPPAQPIVLQVALNREKDHLPLNHCAASSSQYGERRLVDLPDAWRLADMTNTSASFICSWFFDAWPYLTVRPSPTNY